MQSYLFNEGHGETFLVPAALVVREYYVDEGFYLLDGGDVVFACPECGELVNEGTLAKIVAHIPETKNEGLLQRHGVFLEDDMLFEAMECFSAHVPSLVLESFDPKVYQDDETAFQLTAELGNRQLASDTAKPVQVQLLAKDGKYLFFQMGDHVVSTISGRILGVFSTLSEAKKDLGLVN